MHCRGVALGMGFVFTLSFFAFRKSKCQAVGKKGPLLETAPLFLVPQRHFSVSFSEFSGHDVTM
jgi:hypothetical protein